jgi:hypothetical protein
MEALGRLSVVKWNPALDAKKISMKMTGIIFGKIT